MSMTIQRQQPQLHLLSSPADGGRHTKRSLKDSSSSSVLVVQEASCNLYTADVPTISCTTKLVDENYQENADDAWENNGATYSMITSMCTFEDDYSMVTCTVMSGGDLLEQLDVTCNVSQMNEGPAVACSCQEMYRGLMDAMNCPYSQCLSNSHQDWTDDCKWCYVERHCEQCIFDGVSSYNFVLPWYASFVADVQSAYQDMADSGQEEYLLEGLEEYANAGYSGNPRTSILWNVLGQTCDEERLAEDGVSMIQTPVADEGHSGKSSTFAFGIALILSAVIGAAIYIGYRVWEKRQYKKSIPDAQGFLL